MEGIKWHTEVRKISELKEWEDNPRTISESRYERLKESIKKRGFHDIIKIDEKNVVLSGNQRLKALKELGYEEVECKVSDKKLTQDEKDEVAIESNMQDGEWDMDKLAEGFSDVMEEIGYGDLLPEVVPEVEEDDYEEPEDLETTVVLGDVYQLGEHRLMCGDSTKIEDVEKLMNGEKADMVFTDPPYGAGFDIKNDDGNYLQVFADFYSILPCDDNIYVCCDFRCIGDFYKEIQKRHQIYNLIIWVKNLFGQGKLYHTKHEEIIFCGSGAFESKNSNNDENVWNADSVRNFGGSKNAKEAVGHPTQKPVEICARAISNSSNKGSVVFDGFGGSGSTLIACEQTNRRCYMMELDPHYCQVIIDRWEKYTNKEAKKL
jgi:DNA modification methylase